VKINLKTKLTDALSSSQAHIYRHISNQNIASRSGDIEKEFAKALHKQFDNYSLELEASLRKYGGQLRVGKRRGGRIDCVLNGQIGLEYKAVRMPRMHSLCPSTSLWDAGQLSGDYVKISEAGKLDDGYLIAFLYGPFVEASKTTGDLYRHFHNQMFVDFSIADEEEDWADHDGSGLRPRQRIAVNRMGWDRPWPGKRVRPGVIAAKCAKVAAICIPVGRDPLIPLPQR
jgi:hypothetical protein